MTIRPDDLGGRDFEPDPTNPQGPTDEPPVTAGARHCQTCGRLLDREGEFHPYIFCVLHKAGRDPWGDTRWLAEQLGLGALPKKPPLVKNLRREPAA